MDEWQKVKIEASRIERHRTRSATSGFYSTKTTEELLKKLPFKVRARVVRPAVRAAAKVIRKRVRQNLNATGSRSYNDDGTVVRGQPIGRSRKTGTYEKLSKELKSKRSGNKEMSKAIITRNWTKSMGEIVGNTTGPSYKHAAQGHLLEYGANIQLWGKSNKRYQLPPRPFLRTAVTSTRGLQKIIILNVMKKWAKLVRQEVEQYPDVEDS